MADLNQIEQALRAADAAGNKEDARRLAEAYAAARAEQAPEQQANATQHPNTLGDVIHAIPGGVAKGVAAIAGLPGDAQNLMGRGMDWVAGKLGGDPDKIAALRQQRESDPFKFPTSEGINNAVSKPFGGYYQPQTVPGQYAETIASFAPNAILPGSGMARAARVVVPGAASEAAGQATKGSKWEPLARAGGAIIGGLGEGMAEGAIAARANPAPTEEALRKTANNLYRQSTEAGVTVKADAYDNLIGDIKGAVKEAGTHPKLHPKVAGALESLDEVKGADIALGDLERLRRIAKGAASSIEPDERRVAGVILDKLDDFMDGLSPEQVIAGDASAAHMVSEARATWAKLRKSETIENAIERAKLRATTQNGNYAASLRGEFQALLKNKKAMRGFGPDEISAIEQVAKVGPVEGVAAAIGAMRPRGLTGAVEGTGALTHILSTGDLKNGLPYLGMAAAGQGAQMGLNASTARNAKLAAELMRRGAPAANATPLSQSLLVDLLLSQQGAHR